MPVRNMRRRYLLFQLNTDTNPKKEQLFKDIKKNIIKLYGIKGMAYIDPNFIEYNVDKKRGIIRCSHIGLRRLRATLANITTIGGLRASIQVLVVSGTLKALREKTIY